MPSPSPGPFNLYPIPLGRKRQMLVFWLPVLTEALEEVNLLLSRRNSTLNLNGKLSLLLLAKEQGEELLRHLKRLLPEEPINK